MSNLEIIFFAIYVMSTLAVLFHYTDNSRDSEVAKAMGSAEYISVATFVSFIPVVNTIIWVRLIWKFIRKS